MGFVGGIVLLFVAILLLAGVFSGAVLGTHDSAVQSQRSVGAAELALPPPTYSIVGANTTTITWSSTPDSSAYSSSFTLRLQSTQIVRLGLADLYNGTLTVPKGTTVKVTVDSQSFVLEQVDNSSLAGDPVFTLPSGETLISYTITIPASVHSGVYNLGIAVDTYSGNLAQVEASSPYAGVTYGNSYWVTIHVE